MFSISVLVKLFTKSSSEKLASELVESQNGASPVNKNFESSIVNKNIAEFPLESSAPYPIVA